MGEKLLQSKMRSLCALRSVFLCLSAILSTILICFKYILRIQVLLCDKFCSIIGGNCRSAANIPGFCTYGCVIFPIFFSALFYFIFWHSRASSFWYTIYFHGAFVCLCTLWNFSSAVLQYACCVYCTVRIYCPALVIWSWFHSFPRQCNFHVLTFHPLSTFLQRTDQYLLLSLYSDDGWFWITL